MVDLTNLTNSIISRTIMNQSNNLEDGLGPPSLELACYLLLSWIVIFLVMIKGVKSSGKVSYFLALFPYVVLVTLLARALTLEGSWNGVKYFITPDFKKLLEPQVCKFYSKEQIYYVST